MWVVMQVHGGTEWGRVPRDHVEVRQISVGLSSIIAEIRWNLSAHL